MLRPCLLAEEFHSTSRISVFCVLIDSCWSSQTRRSMPRDLWRVRWERFRAWFAGNGVEFWRRSAGRAAIALAECGSSRNRLRYGTDSGSVDRVGVRHLAPADCESTSFDEPLLSLRVAIECSRWLSQDHRRSGRDRTAIGGEFRVTVAEAARRVVRRREASPGWSCAVAWARRWRN